MRVAGTRGRVAGEGRAARALALAAFLFATMLRKGWWMVVTVWRMVWLRWARGGDRVW